MPSQFDEPKAPQAEVVTGTADNSTARVGAYTDTAITKRNVNSSPAPTPSPSRTGHVGKDVRRFYAEDGETEIENTASNPSAEKPPHSPNSWTPGRDPYANNGMVGQDFLRNQS